MKNVLVIGGSGFIGSNIIEELAKDSEYNLIVLLKEGSSSGSYIGAEKINFEFCRLYDLAKVQQIIAAYDIQIVIHLASTLIPSSGDVDFYNEMNQVIVPTMRLVDICENKGILFIFFSSGGTIYGEWDKPINEDCDLNPITYYGYSKQVIEDYITLKSRISSLNYLILRPSNVYGKHQRIGSGQGFIANAIYRSLKGLPIEIWGDGLIERDYIDVDDVIVILKKLIQNSITCQSINISTGVGYCLLDIVSLIKLQINKDVQVDFFPMRKVDARKIILDNSRLLSQVSHDFVDLNEGLKKFIEYQKVTHFNL